jgi:hypothetical protein
MYGRSNKSAVRTRTLVIYVAAAILVGGTFALGTGISNAAENCTALAQEVPTNLTVVADQQTRHTADDCASHPTNPGRGSSGNGDLATSIPGTTGDQPLICWPGWLCQ